MNGNSYLKHCKAWCLPANNLVNACHGIQAVIIIEDCEFFNPYLVQMKTIAKFVLYNCTETYRPRLKNSFG